MWGGGKLTGMKPAEPPKDPKSETVAQPLPHLSSKEIANLEGNPSHVEVKRDAMAHGERIDPRDYTPAELEAASMRRATESKADAEKRAALLKRDPSTLTTAERDFLARPIGNPDADALAARDRVRAAVLHADDAARIALLHGVDGRTTTIARELEGDAAVLEQLAAQLRLDARDLRTVTSAQTTTIDVAVARLRAFAAQLVALCASRDIPLPQIPTLPAPPHVPPARA